MRPALTRPTNRFATKLAIIDGGGGTFSGTITEPSEGSSGSGQPDTPRRMLVVPPHLPITAGLVIQTLEGYRFLTGSHGSSEGPAGPLFRSFMLFEADKHVTWQRRNKVRDAVTGIEQDSNLTNLPMIWGTYTPDQKKIFDRQVHVEFETGQFLTNQAVQRDDIVDGKRVTRVDFLLGLWYLTLG